MSSLKAELIGLFVVIQ